MASDHRSSSIRRIDALVSELREIRSRFSQGAGMSPDDRGRVAAIDAELDQLWIDRRLARTPMRPPSPMPRLGRR
jgi:hypothetical protein